MIRTVNTFCEFVAFLDAHSYIANIVFADIFLRGCILSGKLFTSCSFHGCMFNSDVILRNAAFEACTFSRTLFRCPMRDAWIVDCIGEVTLATNALHAGCRGQSVGLKFIAADERKCLK